MSNDLRIGLVISDLEMRFSVTFRSCAEDYYGVAFDNSDVADNLDKLKTLLERISRGGNYGGRMRYKITKDDVAHIIQQFQRVLERYNQLFGTVPPNLKLYTMFRMIRDAEAPNAEEIAKKALEHILSPVKPRKKPTRQEEADQLSRQRQLERIRKNK